MPITPTRIDPQGDERLFYETLLLARDDTPGEGARSRAATLHLILDAARLAGTMPTPDLVRWHLFDSPPQVLPTPLEAQRLAWEAYQCQDLMQVASATLLAWAIAIMNAQGQGSTLAEIRVEVETHLSHEPAFARSWHDLRLASPGFPFREAWDNLTSTRGAPASKAARAVLLMAALHQRLADRPALADAVNHRLPVTGSAHSLRTERAWLENREAQNVVALIADYMIERVVRRHSWVAMQKLRRQRDYTFLFEQRDARLAYLSGYQPVATTPRLAPAIQFLEDIHLLDPQGPTALGHAALEAAL